MAWGFQYPCTATGEPILSYNESDRACHDIFGRIDARLAQEVLLQILTNWVSEMSLEGMLAVLTFQECTLL